MTHAIDYRIYFKYWFGGYNKPDLDVLDTVLDLNWGLKRLGLKNGS